MATLSPVTAQQPLVTTANGLATTAWLAWFRDATALINSLSAQLTTLQATVTGIQNGTIVVGAIGGAVYPLGGGDVALVSNPSNVWMTVKNAQHARINWTAWAGRTLTAYLQVHSDANAVAATARVVAVDSNGAVTRVLGTGTASQSTGLYTSGWSPLEAVTLATGSGVETCVLQVSTAAVSQLVSAAGYVEVGTS